MTSKYRTQVLQLYKTLYYMGKEYPKGSQWFHSRLKNAFQRNMNESDEEKIAQLIKRGEFVAVDAMSAGPKVRLADYFVVIELDESQIRHGCSNGSITQRFPEDDWPEIPLSPSLNIFCCPQGWSLTTDILPPSFFSCTLTDLSGCHQYACCLQILEPCSASVTDISDDICGLSPSTSTGATIYKPKIYVILSRFPYFDLYRNCLNRIAEALINGDQEAAGEMVAGLVSNIYLTSSPKTMFFNLAAHRFSVKPLTWPTVPITAQRIATLASQLGTIYNLLAVMCCLLRDQKLIIISNSVSRLSDAAYALKSLLYPFEYSYAFVSILPEMALECLESPTPYIMGVHSALRDRIPDVDACVVDLDIGCVEDPLKTTLDIVPEPFLSRLIALLQSVLNPGLATADHAFQTGVPPPLSLDVLDKRIRACFLRFFAELLYGYRSCLQLVRLHDNPLIIFHKSAFLGMRNLYHSEMLHSLLNSLMFQSFIAERGLPYRSIDLFDEIVATLDLKDEVNELGKGPLMDEILAISKKLEDNEKQEVPTLNVVPLSRQRSLSTTSRFFCNAVPPLNAAFVSSKIQDNLNNLSNEGTVHCIRTVLNGNFRSVPVNASLNFLEEQLGASSRRLQVLHLCLQFIFDARLSDARKILSAVELSMRSSYSRVALCQLLWTNLQPVNRATLHPQQFDLLCRLINCALENESKEDEHGIAYAFLYLSNIYCRRLNAGVLQFLYTCIQDHAVWDNQRFWETAFFHDVHQQMRRLYSSKNGKIIDDQDDNARCPYSLKNTVGTWNLLEEPSAMRIASARLEQLGNFSEYELKQLCAEEHAIVYGQAKHYINLMVYLRVPLDASRLRRVNLNNLERKNMDDGNSHASDSAESDTESGFIESTVDDTDLGASTVKWISKLIDRICSAAGLPQDQIERLNEEIPGFVGLHIDNLEQVHIESKRISPLHKPKIVQPVLLPSEKVLVDGLRAFLLPDGRDQTVTGLCDPHTAMLPSEGALFLTNYRVVFKGQPCNPFLCERSIVRSMPIMSITKDKQISDHLAQNPVQLEGIPSKSAHRLHDALQIRSSAFQLMKVAFDEEVEPEDVDNFMRTLNGLRWPQSQPRTYFAFSSVALALYSGTALAPGKGKYNTFRELRRTWVRNPLKNANEKRKTVNVSPFTSSKMLHHTSSGSSLPTRAKVQISTECDLDKTATQPNIGEYIDFNNMSESKALIKEASLGAERHYLLDYCRLGFLAERQHRFRISHANEAYELCRSYPNVLIVPATVSDEHFMKIAKGFKLGRFPVITWQNSKGAFLARGSGLNGKTVVAKIKKQANFLGSVGSALEVQNSLSGHGGSRLSLSSDSAFLQAGASGSSSELQARYMSTLTYISPPVSSLPSSSLYGSLASLYSLDTILTADGASMISSSTPDMPKKSYHGTASELTRTAATFVRNNGSKTFSNRNFSSTSVSSVAKAPKTSMGSSQGSASRLSSILNLTRNSLYILGDKANAKSMKLEKHCEFIPIAYPTAHNVKAAFKKLLRVTVPSWLTPVDGSVSFFKMLDDTGWMQMLSQLLCISNSIVDIVDLHHSSVVLCIEDGWDSTCQLSSLAQLLLDPYYRTIEGFRVLVEKEWLAFGYRFMHRGNHSASSQASGIAPMFIMFLDAVHQVWTQYPNAFEFNDFYLRFLAFHSTSCHFATFLFDTEMERIHFSEAFSVYSKEHAPPQSVFTYIDDKLKNSPIQFYNFKYVAGVHSILRPEVGIVALQAWEWYSEDHLAHGSCYDLEICEKEFGEREQECFESADNRASVQMKRNVRVLDNSYRCTDLMETNAFAVHLENLGRLQTLVNDKSTNDELSDWRAAMNEASEIVSKSEKLKNHEPDEWNRRVHRAVHKKDTFRLLLRGTSHQLSNSRIREAHIQSSIGKHSFVQFSGIPAALCALCNQPLIGAVPQKSYKCNGCGLIAHEMCSNHITWQCSSKEKNVPVQEERTLESPLEEKTEAETLSDRELTLIPRPPHSTSYLHSGVLLKKGATFKLWKPRWFVLDASRHELRYYDSENDVSCKGLIDLAEVKGVDFPPARKHSGALGNMFELRTTKRMYSLLAESKTEAEEWVEKIESVLRE
ncbi:hypothetical protein QR680_002054 [Steinernema hermaphroditum]|uniref:Myotubularin-related protein 13 n=1 Tax=Steinernema hermaphroditum TaxID=289476 RepID=A0AA39H125_9BILA|nr:hypothetical protein QR680_002054 [Steinernema hermaphroditum]